MRMLARMRVQDNGDRAWACMEYAHTPERTADPPPMSHGRIVSGIRR